MMQRKVIQIANSTQLISLPRKWALKYSLKKGDVLDVEEQGNKLIISNKGGLVLDKVELDVTNLDRSSIMYYIRSAYRMGYNEIEIKFENPTTKHFRLNENLNVLSIIHTEVNRLVGLAIMKQTEKRCVIKDISEGSIKEFDTVLRRVFLLLKDVSDELVNGIKKRDFVLLQTIEQKHDTVTKFISYCLRLLNKYGYPDTKKTTVLYHTIASLDKVMDVIKYIARDVLDHKLSPRKETEQVLDMINVGCIDAYIDLFYKFDIKRVVDFTQNRDDVLRIINDCPKKISPCEILILAKMSNVLEVLLDLIESRMSLEHSV